jgi:hypothetical protein
LCFQGKFAWLFSITCMYVCFMQLLCLLPSLASQKPVLRGNTSCASNPQKPSYFQRVHYKFLCMVFQAIPSKFSCATFQKLSTNSHFVPLFLAHEDVVVGFVIFHTKLSTPWLACFISSSLILQGSWSDHCNLKKEKRKEKGTPPRYVKVGGHPMESVSHGLRKEKVGRSSKP